MSVHGQEQSNVSDIIETMHPGTCQVQGIAILFQGMINIFQFLIK